MIWPKACVNRCGNGTQPNTRIHCRESPRGSGHPQSRTSRPGFPACICSSVASQKLEDVLLLGVESTVFVAVSAQVPQQCRHLVPFPAVAKFGSRPSGEVLQEIYFTSILEIVRYVGDRLLYQLTYLTKEAFLTMAGCRFTFSMCSRIWR